MKWNSQPVEHLWLKRVVGVKQKLHFTNRMFQNAVNQFEYTTVQATGRDLMAERQKPLGFISKPFHFTKNGERLENM